VYRFLLTVLAFLTLFPSSAPAAGKAEHVVVVVWDGLRPDSVNERDTPTLYKLAGRGVFFQNHHAVYLSSTEVNGVAIATGAYPARNGILANREYRPIINPLKRVQTESYETVRKGDEVTHGHYLQLPTMAEILQRAGFKTAIAGTKAIAMLHDRSERDRVCPDCVTLFADRTVPAAAINRLKLTFTPPDKPNTRRDAQTTEALIGALWDNGVPKFSLLWLSEPDFSQHETGLGSETSRAALKGSDQNLSRVLDELTAKGVRDKTDVFVVSDHGFSTISRTADVAKVLKKAGFHATREFEQPPADGDIMVIGNGGSVVLYVIGHDPKLVREVVKLLQQQDFVGVLFTREPMEGTFTLEQARINTSDAPDIVVSLRWTEDKNPAGIAGSVPSDGWYVSGQGIHSSLSPFDMRATLVAAGPDFRTGMIDQLPSGNADLAPTILHLFEIRPPQKMDGRILIEAIGGGATSRVLPPIEARTLEAARDFDKFVWHQYLRVTEFGGAIYFDEGNGTSVAK
jgi:arylsulfatase A-like enzyme